MMMTDNNNGGGSGVSSGAGSVGNISTTNSTMIVSAVSTSTTASQQQQQQSFQYQIPASPPRSSIVTTTSAAVAVAASGSSSATTSTIPQSRQQQQQQQQQQQAAVTQSHYLATIISQPNLNVGNQQQQNQPLPPPPPNLHIKEEMDDYEISMPPQSQQQQPQQQQPSLQLSGAGIGGVGGDTGGGGGGGGAPPDRPLVILKPPPPDPENAGKVVGRLTYLDDTLFICEGNQIDVGRNSSTSTVNFHVGKNNFISRKHFQIIHDTNNGDFYVIIGSKNGIFIDDIFNRKSQDLERLPPICYFRFPSTDIRILFESYTDQHHQPQQQNQPQLFNKIKSGGLLKMDIGGILQNSTNGGGVGGGGGGIGGAGSGIGMINPNIGGGSMYSSPLKIKIPKTEKKSPPLSPAGTISAANSCPTSPRQSFRDFHTSYNSGSGIGGGSGSIGGGNNAVGNVSTGNIGIGGIGSSQFNNNGYSVGVGGGNGGNDLLQAPPPPQTTSSTSSVVVSSVTGSNSAGGGGNGGNGGTASGSVTTAGGGSGYNEFEKPLYSYAQLIVQSISASPEKQLTLSGIYSFITKNYPYYRKEQNKGWQNSIRHNLSLNRYFLKVERSQDEPGKGSFWRIDPNSEAKLIDQSYRKRRQRGSQCFRTPYGLPRSAPASPNHMDNSRENSPLHDIILQSAPGSPDRYQNISQQQQQQHQQQQHVGQQQQPQQLQIWPE